MFIYIYIYQNIINLMACLFSLLTISQHMVKSGLSRKPVKTLQTEGQRSRGPGCDRGVHHWLMVCIDITIESPLP